MRGEIIDHMGGSDSTDREEGFRIESVLVGIPFHSKYVTHVEYFEKNLPELLNQCPDHACIYVDANGCAEEVIDALQGLAQRVKQIELHIEKQGGRPHSLNRITEKAINDLFDVVIFLNDDLVLGRDTLRQILERLQHEEIIGGLSRPLDPRRNNEMISMAQLALVNYYLEQVKPENWKFSGDCFGIRRSLLEQLKPAVSQRFVFPQLHSDDLVLPMTLERVRGIKKIPIQFDASVYFYPPKTWKQCTHRIARHLQGGRQAFHG